MKAAIIGAGPSGFFVAGEILKRCPGCEVHLFERRIAPFGLVRFGVAPDHQHTRRAAKILDQIAEHARFHYHGNVEVGRDVTWDELAASFHAVVVCTGAEQPQRPELPGGRLRGAADALDFSRWANGETEAFDRGWLDGVETAVIIGNGNVALDAARMLARPAADWVSTDIAVQAMEALAHHRVRRIVIAGRRGPGDASFTEAELSEVVNLPGWDVRTNESLPFDLKPEGRGTDRRLEFLFHHRPACLLGGDRVMGVRFSHSINGSTLEVPAQLVLFATGHRGVKIDGLPFDQTRGVIPNQAGRVKGRAGFYVCGWIKRGAKGLIGQNRKDAIETVASLIEERDMLSARQVEPVDWYTELARRGVRAVSWSDWKKIDALEVQRGAAVGRPRINLTRVEALSLFG